MFGSLHVVPVTALGLTLVFARILSSSIGIGGGAMRRMCSRSNGCEKTAAAQRTPVERRHVVVRMMAVVKIRIGLIERRTDKLYGIRYVRLKRTNSSSSDVNN